MTTEAPTNWPNPERPGVPLFPERSDFHRVGDSLMFWYSDIQKWVTSSPIQGCKMPEDLSREEYHGPCLTPTQISEMLEGERERCAKVVQDLYNSTPEGQILRLKTLFYAAKEIRNLGDAP